MVLPFVIVVKPCYLELNAYGVCALRVLAKQRNDWLFWNVTLAKQHNDWLFWNVTPAKQHNDWLFWITANDCSWNTTFVNYKMIGYLKWYYLLTTSLLAAIVSTALDCQFNVIFMVVLTSNLRISTQIDCFRILLSKTSHL